MFTTCPKCALNLAVTAADLRVGQGYVRCGRCANVFNALIGLSDDLVEGDAHEVGAETGAGGNAGAPASTPTIAADEDTHESETLRNEPSAAPVVTDEIADFAVTPEVATDHDFDDGAPELNDSMIVEELSGPGDDPLAETGRYDDIVIESGIDDDDIDEPSEPEDEPLPEGTGTFTTIVLEGETITQTQEVVDEEIVDERLKEISERLGGNAEDTTVAAEERPRSMSGRDLAEQLTRDLTPEGNTSEEESRSRLGRGAGTVGCVVLVLVLGAQAVHHWRTDIAATKLGAPLASLYAAMGKPLEPHYDVLAYQVRRIGEGATRSGAGRDITLRATVHNTASRAQPLPLLRVTLQDVFGNDIALRDVEPREYLGRTAHNAQPTQLAPDQRVDAEVVVVDASKKAEGFELDACLRAAGGALSCASEQGPLAARR